MAASQDTTDVLRNANFSHLDGPAASVTAADLLLGGAYDPAKLHPMSGLSDNLDYLLLEDDKVNELPGSGTAIPSRGWSDDLCYGTGTMYLTGQFPFFIHITSPSAFYPILAFCETQCRLVSFIPSISFTLTLSSILLFSLLSHAHSCSLGLGVGGVWGLREGVRRPLAVSNSRLRINSILNSVTRRGTFIGNSAGVLGTLVRCLAFSDTYARLALVYNGINSSIDHWRGRHDAAGSMVAGALTGAIYKSTGVCFFVSFPESTHSYFQSSRCEARFSGRNIRVWPRWHLEFP